MELALVQGGIVVPAHTVVDFPIGCAPARGESGLPAATYQVYGVTVAVRANEPRHWANLLAALPLYTPMESHRSPDLDYVIVWDERFAPECDPAHGLYRGGECIYRTRDAETLIHALQVDVVRAVARASRDHIFVHAGAVTYGGKGILLPGVPGAGKSTLVRYLLERGAQYYSDEYAVLDGSGKLYPFPCRLRLGASSESKLPYAHEELGAVAGHGAAPVDCVAFPTYEPGATHGVEALPRSSAALYLLAHTPQARTRPRESMTAVSMAASRAQCYRVRYSYCKAVADLLFSSVEPSSSTRHSTRRESEKT